MGSPAPNQQVVQFADYVLNLQTAELRRNGTKIVLQDQPFQILTTLIESPGRLVLREELIRKLWPNSTFVDFEQSLNRAIARLRESLCDDAEHPRFIETLPRKGYRWIGALEPADGHDCNADIHPARPSLPGDPRFDKSFADSSHTVRFGIYEADFQNGELRKNGVKVKLYGQPLQVLAILLEHPGVVVTRQELQRRLWPSDTYVDFEHGINAAVNRLREALGDDTEQPEYIETMPRRGYRFIAPIHSNGMNLAGAVPSFKDANATDGKDLPRAAVLRFAILGAFALLTGGLLFEMWMSRPADELKILSFQQLTNDGRAKLGALRTDGTRIYMTEFQPARGIFLAQVSVKGGPTEPRAAALRAPRSVDLSRDGTELLLLNDESHGPKSLWIQSVVEGAPRPVGDLMVDTASWGPDDECLTYCTGHDIFIVRKDGRSSRKLLTVPGIPSDLRFSIDGKRLRFTLADDQDHTTSLWEVSADGTNLHPLLVGWNTPASECCGNWTADGGYFVFQSTQNGRTNLWAIRENNRLLPTMSEKPVPLTSGPINFFDPISSKDGRELFAVGVLNRSQVVRYDLRTHRFIPFLAGISAEGLDFSRDGNWVTYTSYPEGTLWRSKIDGSNRLQLTFPPMRAFLPRWSPDGGMIVFMGSPPSGPWKLGGPWKLYLISPDGGTPQRLLPGEQDESDPIWSADGNYIAFGRLAQPWNSTQNANALNIELLDVKSRKLSTLPGSDGLFSPRWSPDGRYILAFKAKHPMKPQLFDLVTQRWTQIADSEMGYPSWSRDGTYISMQDWNDGHPRIARLFLRDRRIEGVINFTELEGNMAGTILAWSGLAPDGSPLIARDISVQEIYALKTRNQ